MVIRYKLVISMKRYEKCVINAKSPKGLLLAHLAPICTWKQEAHPISPLLSLHRPGQSQPKAGPLQIPLANSSKPCVAQGHPLQTTNFLSFSSSPLLGRVRCVLVSSWEFSGPNQVATVVHPLAIQWKELWYAWWPHWIPTLQSLNSSKK